MTPIPEGSQITLTNLTSEVIDELVNHQLPASLLEMLERRWYDNFDIATCHVRSAQPTMLEAEARFMQVFEVATSTSRLENLQLGNMQNVLSSLRDGSHAVTYVVTSDGKETKLLLGVRRVPGSAVSNTDAYLNVLYRSLRSNYPGIVLSRNKAQNFEDLPFERYQVDLLKPLKENRYLGALTGIPSLRTNGPDGTTFHQSIDRLVDALRGESYTFMVLAQPILESRLTQLIAQLRSISEEVHTLVLQSRSISRSETESKSTTATESKQLTLGVGQLLSAVVGIGGSISQSIGETVGASTGLSASITRERLDKTAQVCEQLLDHSIARLQTGRSLGFWNTGVFISSSDPNTFWRAQSIVRGLFSGHSTYVEPIRLLPLGDSREVKRAITNLQLPVLESIPNRMEMKHPLGQEYQCLSTPLTTDELSLLVSFPAREVPGMKIKPVADFNLNPPEISGAEIGSLLYRGEKLDKRIAISSKSLTRHTFITGLTGSGKTNTCLALIEDAYRKHGLNFLVIDPAKTEYRFLLNSETLGREIMIFTLGDEKISPFRINPFEFVRGFSLLGHIDLIKAVFNAAFPMYASMPYILEESILDVYQERGWDVASSQNRFLHGDIDDPDVDFRPYLPRLSDLYAKIDTVVARKRYDVRIAQDLTAALKARLGSLLNGGKGLMFDTQRSIPIETLLNRPVLLELRHAGDEDERAFVMSLIFVLLYEACQNRPVGDQMNHVTLIEEAHRLLRNIPISTSLESANPRGKTVEMFSDMMAEMRSHGEGFIIVDQMPNKLVPDVIKGSNLKIVHRLMAQDDRIAVGAAMGLNTEQIDHLPRLRQGEAVIHSEELEEACLILIDSVEERLAVTHSNHVEREDQIIGEIKKRTLDFYKQNPALLQKYPGCVICHSPCNYYVGEDARILTESLVRLGQQYLALIAIGSSRACISLGTRLQKEINNRMREHFGEQYSAGQKRCIQVLLAARCARNFAQSYSHVVNWQAVIQLQELLAQAWEAWPTPSKQLNDIRKLILGRIAIAPVQARAGCTACPHRCWFGFSMQTKGHVLVQQVTAFLQAEIGRELSADDLIVRVRDYYGERIEDQLVPHAAYCLLTQCTDDESLLRKSRNAVLQRKV